MVNFLHLTFFPPKTKWILVQVCETVFDSKWNHLFLVQSPTIVLIISFVNLFINFRRLLRNFLNIHFWSDRIFHLSWISRQIILSNLILTSKSFWNSLIFYFDTAKFNSFIFIPYPHFPFKNFPSFFRNFSDMLKIF